MSNNVPLISIITVVYNGVEVLEQTILSVINQTYPNIEYIIIDGGSTDGTVDIIKKYADKITYWVSEVDDGIFHAMNKGIDVANGDWINFMNAGDDFVGANVIAQMFAEKIEEDKLVLYGNSFFIGKKSSRLLKAQPLNNIKTNMPFTHQATFTRIKPVKVFFDTQYKIAADYNFFYNLYWKFGELSFQYIDLAIVNYEAEDGVSSKNKFKLWQESLWIRSLHKDITWYIDRLKEIIKIWLKYQ